jgi:diguanylate cyclase (GGDEF)-like protein
MTALLAIVLAGTALMSDPSGVTALDGTWEARLSDEGGDSGAGAWSPVRVPGNFRFQGLEYDGIVWLKTAFSVAEVTQDLAVRIPPAANAYELFLNGTRLGGRGVIGPGGELLQKDFRAQVYRLPRELLRASEPNTLSLRLRTFYGNGGVIAPGVMLGPEALVRDAAEARVVKVSMLVALFLFAALFHLLLYLGRMRERQYRSFAFLATMLALVTAGINMLGYVVSSNADFNAYLVFVPLTLLPIAFVQFFSDFYGRVVTWRRRVLVGFSALALLILVLSTLHHPLFPFYERAVLPLVVLVLVGTLVLCTAWTVQAFRRNQRGAKAIVLGLAVYAAAGVMELAWTFSLLPLRIDSHVGFAFFVMAMVVAISERFAWLHRQVELGEKDALTGCLTRHGFRERLPALLAVRGAPLSCVLFDLDHFKRINDLLGHVAGDRVLASTGYVVRSVLREGDVVVRWGGEEFFVALPGHTTQLAMETAERLRNAVQQHDAGGIKCTASFGVATRFEDEPFEAWVARADEALYAAKAAGRNCIHAAGAETTSVADQRPLEPVK